MISITPAYKTSLAAAQQKKFTCWFVKLQSGTVLGFTDLDIDLIYNLESFLTSVSRPIVEVTGSGMVTYNAKTGYTRTDIVGSSDLSVDNMEVDGIISAPSITESDLRTGIWDYAFYIVFQLEFSDLSNTTGAMILKSGRLGEVTLERNTFKAELRGLAQAYSRTIGELTQPGCRAELYDARCKVVAAPFTKTGTLTGVNPDKITFYDTARTEPGPVGGVAITAITNSNPGHVTVASAAGFSNGKVVTFANILGPALLNTDTIIRNLSGNTFDLGIDTSNVSIYPAYSGSGIMTPLGGSLSGYFDFGVMTMTSGAANGLKMEVRSYVPGQWILQLPFADGLLTPVAGDTYTMTAGCDKSKATCKAKFSNVINMRAEPDLPGLDKIVQVGKQPSGA